MLRATKVLKGGLQDVADELGVHIILIPLNVCLISLPGLTHGSTAPSWFRFTPYCLDVLENARNLLQQPNRRL